MTAPARPPADAVSVATCFRQGSFGGETLVVITSEGDEDLLGGRAQAPTVTGT